MELAYLAATQAPVGLLLNVGRSPLKYKRILRPKAVQNWQGAIEQYLWKPNTTLKGYNNHQND